MSQELSATPREPLTPTVIQANAPYLRAQCIPQQYRDFYDRLVETALANAERFALSETRVGFNEFLGMVQGRLLKDGYYPPEWPDHTLRDDTDLNSAIDSCVKWCKDRLDEGKSYAPSAAQFAAEDDYAPSYVNGPNGFRFQCYNAKKMAEELNALFARSSEALKIEKHAQIGGTVFHPGIAVETVIDRAYREYEYQQQPPFEAARIAKFKEFVGAAQSPAVTDEMVNRFLSWPLPATVCADLCTTRTDYPHQRVGTNLLTATEARQMLEHVLSALPAARRIVRYHVYEDGNVISDSGDWCRAEDVEALEQELSACSAIGVSPEVVAGVLPVLEEWLAGIEPEDMGWISRLVDELRNRADRGTDGAS